MKKYRVKRKLLTDQYGHHIHRRHPCLWRKKYCGVGLCVSGGLSCMIIIGILMLILFLFSQPCVQHSDCQTNNPCSIDSCQQNMCRHERKENCCTRDIDCGGNQCYDSFCDFFTHKCNAIPQANGTKCVDSDSCTIDDHCQSGKCIGNH